MNVQVTYRSILDRASKGFQASPGMLGGLPMTFRGFLRLVEAAYPGEQVKAHQADHHSACRAANDGFLCYLLFDLYLQEVEVPAQLVLGKYGFSAS